MRRSSENPDRPAERRNLARLEQAVHDLARHQHHLQEQIATLADRLEAIASPAGSAPEPADAAPPSAGAAWRHAADRDLKSRLRTLLRRGRALWQATDPSWVEPPILSLDPDAGAAWPSLAIVLMAATRERAAELDGFGGLDEQTHRGAEWLFWDRESGRVRVETPAGDLLREVEARSTEALRRATEASYVLTFGAAFQDALPTVLELAVLTLACEPLRFVEIAPDASGEALLVVERDLWAPRGLDEDAFWPLLRRRAEDPVLGKVLPASGTRAWHQRPTRQPPSRRFARASDWRQAGAYVIADPAGSKTHHALRSPAQLDGPGSAGEASVLLLVDALTGGVERWIADQVRDRPQETYSVAILQPSDPLTADRARHLSRLTRRIYPLADALPAELHPGALTWLRRRLNAESVLDLRSRSAMSFPGLPSDRLDGPPASYCRVDPPMASIDRQALGLPADRVVVSQIADLIPQQRPEDVVALAHEMRGDDRFFFALAGRGPLAGTVEDLARFFGLDNFRLITTAAPDDVLGASDVVCSMADEDPFPYALLEAQALGRPVVGCAAWLEGRVEVGDLAGFARALDRLP